MVELDERDRPKAEKPAFKPTISEHLRYKFSVTIHTDELAILGCLPWQTSARSKETKISRLLMQPTTIGIVMGTASFSGFRRHSIATAF
jgi:hypothetical protein